MGLSQKDLAEKMGISMNYVAAMECGKRDVSELQGLKIVDMLVEMSKHSDPVFDLMKKILLEKS